MITTLQITGKLHYHRKCDFQLSKRKLGYRILLPLTAPILSDHDPYNSSTTLLYCDKTMLTIKTNLLKIKIEQAPVNKGTFIGTGGTLG